VTLADNGSALILMEPPFGAPNWQVMLRKADGSVLDLESVLPPGRSEPRVPSAPQVAMSFNGQVLLEAVNEADNTYEYYRYDGTDLHLLIGGLSASAVDLPRMGNDGNMYFLRRESSGKASLVQTIPEPTALGALVACWTALVLRPRRSRMHAN
jgi:hypothetical protein